MTKHSIKHTISLLTGLLEENGIRTSCTHYPLSENGWKAPFITFSRLMQKPPDNNGKVKSVSACNGFGSSYKSRALSELKSLSEAIEAYSILNAPPLTSHTVGISAGWNKEAVLLNAIYELIEKEACFLAYLMKLPLKIIDPESDTRLNWLVASFKDRGMSLYSYKIRNTFEIPVYMSILVDRSGKGPAIVAGSKAHHDEREALYTSIEEAVMIYVTYKSYSRHRKTRSFRLPVRSPIERSAFWADPEHTNKLSFLFEASHEKIRFAKNTDRPHGLFKRAVYHLEKQNLSWQSVELTPSFFREVGYMVYQVLIPGLQQFYFDDTRKCINTARVENMARCYQVNVSPLNTDPHPFV